MNLDSAQRLEQILVARAGHTPDKTAVVCGKAQLTFQELDRASTALARRLIGHGVRPGQRVGLYITKSVASVVGLFAVLKAGAAYVPLDTTGPLSRSLAIVQRCKIRILLAGVPQLRKLQASPDSFTGKGLQRVVVLSEKDPAPAVDPADLPPSAPAVDPWAIPAHFSGDGALPEPPPPGDLTGTSQDTAYILFTSGSTGTPKGVCISHASSLYFVRWAADFVGLRETDRCSNHAPLFFDLSVFDIFATLYACGTIVIIPPAYSAFPRSLANYIEQQRISVWYSVPSTLVDLLQGGDLGGRDLSALRAIIYAGEVFPVHQLRELMGVLPLDACAYYNLYGPTETNVCVGHKLTRPPSLEETEIPIGLVCKGLTGLLVDEQDQPATDQGELLIKGPAVMQGYFDMPSETAAVIASRPDGDYYRTGDLVRISQGLMYFVGRVDAMVKVGGYRVEPGEVEAALCALPHIAEACVQAVPDAEGKNRLVAFLACENPQGLEVEAVLAALQQKLPKYMIPDQLSPQERFPRTPNGKIDRRALVQGLLSTPED